MRGRRYPRGMIGIAKIMLIMACVSARADEPSLLEREPAGWVDLLAQAGPELRGWTRVAIPPGGAVQTETQWSLDPASGVLTCRGDKGHEWLRWDRELGDGVLHVEWRFVPVEGTKPGYNSGVMIRNSADGKVWHQAQTGGGSGGFLFGDSPVDGALKRVNLASKSEANRVKPAGEWNTFELTAKGPKIVLWTNGAVSSTWEGCEVNRGYVGLEAEGYRIEFRNVRWKDTGAKE